MQIDYSTLLFVPGGVQGFAVEAKTLPQMGWLPNNGMPGQAPVFTSAAQNFSRKGPVLGKGPYPSTIGYIMGLLPMMDIWRFGQMFARLPYGPYTGGDYIREQNRTEFGVGSSPMNLPKLLG